MKVEKERTRERDNRPKFSFKEQKEYNETPGIIEKLEERIGELEEEMAKNASSYGKLQELMEEKEKLEEDLLFRYERYEYLENIAIQIEEYKKNK